MVTRVLRTVLQTAPAAGVGAASIANVVSMETAPMGSPAHTSNENIAADAQMKMSPDNGTTPVPGGDPSPANESISSIDDSAQIVMAAAASGE